MYCMLCVIYHIWCRGDSSLYCTPGFTIMLNAVLWISQLMSNIFPKDAVLSVFVRHQSGKCSSMRYIAWSSDLSVSLYARPAAL